MVSEKKQQGFRQWSILVQGTVALVALLGVISIQRSRLDRPQAVADPRQAEQQEAWRLKLLQQSPTFGVR